VEIAHAFAKYGVVNKGMNATSLYPFHMKMIEELTDCTNEIGDLSMTLQFLYDNE